jgi:ligand-binding sensor protein
LRFAALIDTAALQDLCEHFTALTGAVTAILELDGEVLVATGWQDICTRFHRCHPLTADRCHESDTALAGALRRGEPYNAYHCRNGLVDVAVPIHVQGRHVANFFTGQFFFSPPDRARFERQAEAHGFERDAYLAALDRVPVFDEARIRTMMGFLVRLAEFIGEAGHAQLRLNDANRELREQEAHLEQLVQQRTADSTP